MPRHIFYLPLIVLLFSSFLIGCNPASPSPEPAIVAHTFTNSEAFILNPERGFFTPFKLPNFADFSEIRVTGNTLVYLTIRLDDYRESDIPEKMLNGLQTNFNEVREAGVKAIIRFAYNQGPYPESQPDASKSQILKHIEQLTPLLQENSYVIAWLEAGFIGAWGEWHTSTNGLDNLADKQEILNAVLAAIPNRYVQVRYPINIIEMYPNPADAAKAFVAHHNDCFLSSDTDVGTYESHGVNTMEGDQKYLAELTRFTPISGETCAPNPPRSECTASNYPKDSRAHLWDNHTVRARVTQRSIDVGKAVSSMAQERGLTASQLSLLWTKDQSGITAPIIGPRTLAHLEDALGIISMKLDDADRPLFDKLVHPGTAVADFHNSNDWMKARIFE